MYQSIYYDHQTYTYYLRDDKMGWSDFQYQPTYWKRVDEWQENAQPVLTGGWAAPTKKYSKDDTNLLEKGLWHRGTPFGENGFYNNLSFDTLVNTSYHVLTTDGILGRDIIEGN